MTEKEREQIRKAINLLCEDDGWDQGMAILHRLAGSLERAQQIEDCEIFTASTRRLAKEPASAFAVTEPQKWDVWMCSVGARRNYRATPYREDDSLKPADSIGHLDTVEASTKRRAVSKAVRDAKRATPELFR